MNASPQRRAQPPRRNDASTMEVSKEAGAAHSQEIDRIANALGHVALLYFIGEAIDSCIEGDIACIKK